jgi:hypothetical protein
MHFAMAGGCGDYDDDGDESDDRDAIPTATWRRWPATEYEWIDLETCDVDCYEGEIGDDADADVDEEQEASQANDG